MHRRLLLHTVQEDVRAMSELDYYAKYALGVYGWLLYVFRHIDHAARFYSFSGRLGSIVPGSWGQNRAGRTSGAETPRAPARTASPQACAPCHLCGAASCCFRRTRGAPATLPGVFHDTLCCHCNQARRAYPLEALRCFRTRITTCCADLADTACFCLTTCCCNHRPRC